MHILCLLLVQTSGCGTAIALSNITCIRVLNTMGNRVTAISPASQYTCKQALRESMIPESAVMGPAMPSVTAQSGSTRTRFQMVMSTGNSAATRRRTRLQFSTLNVTRSARTTQQGNVDRGAHNTMNVRLLFAQEREIHDRAPLIAALYQHHQHIYCFRIV
jgi:hypothetical protein